MRIIAFIEDCKAIWKILDWLINFVHSNLQLRGKKNEFEIIKNYLDCLCFY